MSTSPKPEANLVTLCHECGSSIVISAAEGALDELPFVRVRCNDPGCGVVDWYSQREFEPTTLRPQAPPARDLDSGGVWLHDFLLGLSVPERRER